jgi:hypothetical protein
MLLAVLGSGCSPRTWAVLVRTLPLDAEGEDPSTRLKTLTEPAVKLARLQLIKPALSTGGVEQVQPEAGASDWNVIPAGTLSHQLRLVPSAAPSFSTVTL